MKLNQMSQANRRANEGGWVDELAHFPDIAVKVRVEGNSDFEALQYKLWGEIPAERRQEDVVKDEIEVKLIHQTILMDWRGIEGDGMDEATGKPVQIPYDKDLALELLTTNRLFRKQVQYASRIVAARGRDQLEADAKN